MGHGRPRNKANTFHRRDPQANDRVEQKYKVNL